VLSGTRRFFRSLGSVPRATWSRPRPPSPDGGIPPRIVLRNPPSAMPSAYRGPWFFVAPWRAAPTLHAPQHTLTNLGSAVRILAMQQVHPSASCADSGEELVRRDELAERL